MTVSRQEYISTDRTKVHLTHAEYYDRVAQELGLNALKNIVRRQFGAQRIADALTRDEHLNNIPLGSWDALDVSIRPLAGRAIHEKRLLDNGGWSLGDSVCVAKHVARAYIAKEIAA